LIANTQTSLRLAIETAQSLFCVSGFFDVKTTKLQQKIEANSIINLAQSSILHAY
jgi:hypothetical protein